MLKFDTSLLSPNESGWTQIQRSETFLAIFVRYEIASYHSKPQIIRFATNTAVSDSTSHILVFLQFWKRIVNSGRICSRFQDCGGKRQHSSRNHPYPKKIRNYHKRRNESN
ncbi:hypothetical protein CEXT_19781 [Caerostris extrusa]|uniref:Uncharacterized protein n=1 Tax=Caerostris extrusa TaxID=172846 RepID=A0AAV4TXZ4_CAEEX|nr:hypothetical protein CEXT_19781 [Caerostris extrusa]